MSRTGGPWHIAAATHRTLGQDFRRLIQNLVLHSTAEAYGQTGFKTQPKASQILLRLLSWFQL